MPSFGPEYGELTLRTTRAGLASRVGHDLSIVITDWSAEVTLHDDTPTEVRLTAALPSMVVTHGNGGVKPLSAGDKRSIVKNALKTLSANQFPRVTFASTRITGVDGFAVEGVLSIAGVARAQTILVEVGRTTTETSVTVSTVVSQEAFGITPYTAMLGALRVNDAVTIEMHLSVPVAAVA